MIFVTVGTHEQPFNRLIKKVDEMVKNRLIQDEVFSQIGYSTYEPKYCKWSKFLPSEKMNFYMEKADIVICHGGPSTFMKSLSLGKKTIVVPRQKKYDEHVNDHQLKFAQEVNKKGYKILIVENIDDLEKMINKKEESTTMSSNNNQFILNFKNEIKKLNINKKNG